MSSRKRKARRRFPRVASRRHPARRGRALALRLVLAVLLAVAVAALAGGLVLVLGRSAGEPGPPRAAIVDQLELTVPNPEFIASATDILEEGGYAVDYYTGEEVTVDFYRSLPTRDYHLIILRTHSGLLARKDGPGFTDDAVLFTANRYNPETDLSRLSLDDRPHLAQVSYQVGVPPFYLGIKPGFITSALEGAFDGATVIFMGCDLLRGKSMAEAFTQRGAAEVVGWDRAVSAGYTDAATERLLQHMVVDGLSTHEAVEKTMLEIGPDPAFGSELLFYPSPG
jgi:hypothetical protein